LSRRAGATSASMTDRAPLGRSRRACATVCDISLVIIQLCVLQHFRNHDAIAALNIVTLAFFSVSAAAKI